jgi:hypothetical protein
MDRTLVILALTLVVSTASQAAGGRSCYGDTCRDKIMETTQCFVTTNPDAFLRLRSLPSEKA